MRILLWHVHGSWTTSFVQGSHEYVLPVLPDRSPDGLGRARSWDWPSSVLEVAPEHLTDAAPDLVILQRPHEAGLLHQWTGLRVGADVPAVYLEHNTPVGDVPLTRHPMADQDRIPVAHVTHYNSLFWDCGTAATVVIEHGVVDPGLRYTGELPHAAVVTNDPVRRMRFVGADLYARFARVAPLDVFGMRVDGLPKALGLGSRLTAYEDLAQEEMHQQVARRRVYLHTTRWTSLGLSLIEAMHLGLPVVGLATTEASRAVPAAAGIVSADVDELAATLRQLVDDPERAREAGVAARAAALQCYGLKRFLDDWDALLERVAG
jgi:glycosyltransferase involved in cell wall biosynthesis